MIIQKIIFEEHKLCCEWIIELDYRLMEGDYLHIEYLDRITPLNPKHDTPKEFYELDWVDYLIVKSVAIDHNGQLFVLTSIPPPRW